MRPQFPSNINNHATHSSNQLNPSSTPLQCQSGTVVYPQGRDVSNFNNRKTGTHPDKNSIPEWFMQLNSYGAKFGFQFEVSKTKDEWHTIKIESAQREKPNDENNKRYLWNQKTAIQLTRTELPIFTGVMLGFINSARFDNHGDQGKFVEIVNQGKNFFIKTGGTGLNLHVAPIQTVEAYLYGTMGLTQYARNFHGLTTDAAYNIIGALCSQLRECGGYKVPAQR